MRRQNIDVRSFNLNPSNASSNQFKNEEQSSITGMKIVKKSKFQPNWIILGSKFDVFFEQFSDVFFDRFLDHFGAHFRSFYAPKVVLMGEWCTYENHGFP